MKELRAFHGFQMFQRFQSFKPFKAYAEKVKQNFWCDESICSNAET